MANEPKRQKSDRMIEVANQRLFQQAIMDPAKSHARKKGDTVKAQEMLRRTLYRMMDEANMVDPIVVSVIMVASLSAIITECVNGDVLARDGQASIDRIATQFTKELEDMLRADLADRLAHIRKGE